eukprot:1526532-Rhodomonas_salina.1
MDSTRARATSIGSTQCMELCEGRTPRDVSRSTTIADAASAAFGITSMPSSSCSRGRSGRRWLARLHVDTPASVTDSDLV